MFTAKKILPLLFIAILALGASDCKNEGSKTEADFIKESIVLSDMDNRVNGIDDLFYFASQQARNACQENCGALEEKLQASQKKVLEMEKSLTGRGGIVGPPPPPCPCKLGNCLWERFAVFSYFVNLDRYDNMPVVSLQTVNGQEISSSAKAEVTKSPEGNYAVVQLPKADFQDKAVKMVLKSGGESAELLVNLK